MSKRPESVTEGDIERWDANIDNDPNIPEQIAKNEIIREACYAGLWLAEQLVDLKCPQEYIVRIQYTAGQLSFGREPWEVHQLLLQSYKLNDMEFEPDPDNIN